MDGHHTYDGLGESGKHLNAAKTNARVNSAGLSEQVSLCFPTENRDILAIGQGPRLSDLYPGKTEEQLAQRLRELVLIIMQDRQNA
ncbi:hypothetical protein KSF_109090 [Reticulibacter mediterranei]|uniref:Uncharacterized protein n=1 Tax=Reticulibacter mediterranei TaxID=2778369 RepID=A0A8J3J3G7_9CHLR|nr:hypothetical protein KSF_109090 [Reticulibacter mediterranei]